MVCRVCLRKSVDTMSIFSKENQHLKISDIVHKHLGFMTLADNTTTVICTTCWLKLSDFHEYYEHVENVQIEYEELRKQANKNIMDIKLEQDLFLHEPMDIEMENINSAKSNPIFNAKVAENPLDETTMFPLVCFSDASNDQELLRTMKCHNSSGHSSENECLNFLKVKSKLKQIKRKRIIKNNKKSTLKKVKQLNNKVNTSKLDSNDMDALINKHIIMACDLCVFMGQSFADLKEHFLKEHPQENPYVMCCDRKLTKRYYLTQHALKHDDPNHFKCTDCQKTFSNNRGLRAHNLAYHVPDEEKLYVCEMCPQKFATKHLLDLHQPSHISREERSFFCNKCPVQRAFASEYLLQIHNSMRHNRETNVCHVCARSIRDKRSFEKHVRLHFEDSGPRLKCPYPSCDSYLKDEENLKLHLKHHNPEGIIYKCNECDRECKSRVALSSHKKYTHSNKVFPCERCGKSFKKAITLKEHMAQHTGETLYKCPFCTRTFNSNANMHAHKKRMHPIEWDEWRKSKRSSAQKTITTHISNAM